MRLLLGSGGFRTLERVAFLVGQMKSFFGDVRRVLFVPYALQDHEGYVQKMVEKGLNAGYELDGVHRHADPVRAVEQAEAIYIGGGNTFRLLDALYRHRLLEPIRDRAHGGVPYMGVSAGANVACPTVKTTNDMPIVLPQSLDALGLVPFQINPHYYTGQVHVRVGDRYEEHFGETRDDRIREFHEMNETPVIGLWEGGLLRAEGRHLQLLGAPARLFRQGHDPLDVSPGLALDEWLGV